MCLIIQRENMLGTKKICSFRVAFKCATPCAPKNFGNRISNMRSSFSSKPPLKPDRSHFPLH